MKLDTYLTLEAPEGVELGLRVAGPLPRAVAWLVDVLILFGIGTGLFIFLSITLGTTGQGLNLIVIFLLTWAWPVLWEVLRKGMTPGKQVMNLQVLCDDGAPVGWTQSMLRNLLRSVDSLPVCYAVGLAFCLASEDFKRLGDRVAGTIVVHRDRKTPLPTLPDAEPVPVPISLTVDEQSAIVDFAARAPRWTRDRAIEVADKLSSLTGETGERGVHRLYGMARWLQAGR